MSERDVKGCIAMCEVLLLTHQVTRVPATQIQLPAVIPTISPKVASSGLDPSRYKWPASNQGLNTIIEPAHII